MKKYAEQTKKDDIPGKEERHGKRECVATQVLGPAQLIITGNGKDRLAENEFMNRQDCAMPASQGYPVGSGELLRVLGEDQMLRFALQKCCQAAMEARVTEEPRGLLNPGKPKKGSGRLHRSSQNLIFYMIHFISGSPEWMIMDHDHN